MNSFIKLFFRTQSRKLFIKIVFHIKKKVIQEFNQSFEANERFYEKMNKKIYFIFDFIKIYRN